MNSATSGVGEGLLRRTWAQQAWRVQVGGASAGALTGHGHYDVVQRLAMQREEEAMPCGRRKGRLLRAGTLVRYVLAWWSC